MIIAIVTIFLVVLISNCHSSEVLLADVLKGIKLESYKSVCPLNGLIYDQDTIMELFINLKGNQTMFPSIHFDEYEERCDLKDR